MSLSLSESAWWCGRFLIYVNALVMYHMVKSQRASTSYSSYIQHLGGNVFPQAIWFRETEDLLAFYWGPLMFHLFAGWSNDLSSGCSVWLFPREIIALLRSLPLSEFLGWCGGYLLHVATSMMQRMGQESESVKKPYIIYSTSWR